MDTMTDMNCWKVGDEYYDWIEMATDFRAAAGGACSITVRARLLPSDDVEASDSPVADEGIAGVVDAYAEFRTDHLAAHNANPKPFVWTAQLHDLLPKIIRAHETLDTLKHH